jgi:hypothetical protein
MGGDIGRYSSLLTQHNEGVDRQHLGIYNYTFTESDVDNSWSTMYSGTMKDLNILMDKADASNSPHYKGVAQVLFAYTMCTVFPSLQGRCRRRSQHGTWIRQAGRHLCKPDDDAERRYWQPEFRYECNESSYG